jgi:hypothetical protein
MSTAMSTTVLEPTTIEHLDWQPVCEYVTCRAAPPPATHIAIWQCHSIMLCQDSAERLGSVHQDHQHWLVKCHKCKRLINEMKIEPLS